ncbi:MAG: polysaccharide pyruvyl transferase family protein [Pseudoalteromonas nigrifaciens]
MWSHILFIQKLKEKMPDWLKFFLIRVIYHFQVTTSYFITKPVSNYVSGKKNIFVLLSTDYSNLGDHALTYAHIKFLEKHFPDANIIEFVVADTTKVLPSIKKIISKGDIITLKGGGNIGVEYFREELYRRRILRNFNGQKIVIFPQTIFFPDDKFGRKQKEITFSCLKNNKDLVLATRDEASYNQVADILNDRVIFTPDIVLSLDKFKQKKNVPTRSGIVTAMRNDVEGIFSAKDKLNLHRKLDSKFSSITISDTTTDYPISVSMREHELTKIWNLFSTAKVVITDRLHGMIFAYITNTPCIVLKTYNHKLTGQFKWLERAGNIKMARSIDDIIELVDDIDLLDTSDLNLIDNFDCFLNKIKD